MCKRDLFGKTKVKRPIFKCLPVPPISCWIVDAQVSRGLLFSVVLLVVGLTRSGLSTSLSLLLAPTVARPSSGSSTICAGPSLSSQRPAVYICASCADSGLDGFRCQIRSQKPFSGRKRHGAETESDASTCLGPSSPVRSKPARMRSSGAAPTVSHASRSEWCHDASGCLELLRI